MMEINHSSTEGLANAEAEIRRLLLWRTIEQVDGNTLRLDNGTVLRLEGNEGCGGCDAGHYPLTELNGCPNAITAVEFEHENENDDFECEQFRIFVLAENQRIKLAEFQGWDNGYYGTGYWITVFEAESS